MFAYHLYTIAKREPLVRVGCDGRVQGGVTDCNAGSHRNDPSDVLVPVPQLNPKRQSRRNVMQVGIGQFPDIMAQSAINTFGVGEQMKTQTMERP